jgi:inorganic triphosphatase YgiF
MQAMHEIELKFQIPADRLAAVRAELGRLGADLTTPLVLQAAYFDTVDRKLAQARSALRVRREGNEWVQTLKAAGSHTMVRVEDNQPAQPPAAGQSLRPDLSRHSEAARQALTHSLGWHPDADPKGDQCALVELYRTDMRRTRARLKVAEGTPHAGVVELALDEGAILAGVLQEPVRELEIELLSGHPQAVILAGRDWVHRFGLWLDTQTKAHRGDRLARLAATVPPGEREAAHPPPQVTAARAAKVPAGASLDQAWRAGLEACLAHLGANMSELATLPSGQGQNVAYEWRRGLRRLKAFARLMAHTAQGWPIEVVSRANALARQLGHWRDDEALSWIPSQLQEAGGPQVPVPPAPRPVDLPASAADLARSAQATELCLCLLTALVRNGDDDGQTRLPFEPWLHTHLHRQHRVLRRHIREHQRLGDDDAHRLRRRLRNLRDIVELFAAGHASADFARTLDEAISALGRLQDEVVARARYQAASALDPRALFAAGWLLGRQLRTRAQARRALRRWARCSAPW